MQDEILDAVARAPDLLLTPRQRQALALVAHGRSTAELAAELGISPETAADHVKAALGALDARTRAHAVAIALSRGEIRFGG